MTVEQPQGVRQPIEIQTRVMGWPQAGHEREPRKVQVREVIEVMFIRGKGVDDDAVREVTQFYDFDGTFLAEHDEGDDAVALARNG